MAIWNRELPSFWATAAAVAVMHLAFCLFLAQAPPLSMPAAPKPKLHVQTVVFKEKCAPPAQPLAAAVAEKKKPAAKQAKQAVAPEKKKAAAPPKKEVAAPPKKEEAAPVKKQAAAKPKKISSERYRLLSKAEETIAKIDAADVKLEKPKKSVALPKKIGALAVDSIKFEGASNHYQQQLAGALKRMLLLPEQGAVKVMLTLKRSGAVARVKIIKAESDLNKSYIEKELSSAVFSSFDSSLGGASEQTFTITLTNE